MKFEEIVFIVGFPRSGTTMLRSYISESSKMLVHEIEPHWILDLWRLHEKKTISKKDFIPFLLKHKKFPAEGRWMDYLNFTEEILNKLFAKNESYTLKEIVHSIFSYQFRDKDLANEILLLKYPRFTFEPDLLTWLSPKTTIIHIYRDPRSAIASYLLRWNKKSVNEVANYWNRSVKAGFMDFNNLKVIQIQFEELILREDKVLADLWSALNLSLPNEKIEFKRNVRQWETEGKEMVIKEIAGFDTSKLDKWKKSLSKNQVFLIEEYCKDWMKKLGYELTTTKDPKTINHFIFKMYDLLFIGWGNKILRRITTK